MIESIITEYMHVNRRLVLPGVGAFLKKDDGKIVFVPFLNKDDGVLNDLVRQKYGINPAEASELIDQYTEGVKERIGSQGYYQVDVLGVLKRDVNGIIYLDTGENRLFPPEHEEKEAKPDKEILPSEPLMVADKIREEQAPVRTLNDRFSPTEEGETPMGTVARPVSSKPAPPAGETRVNRSAVQSVPRTDHVATGKQDLSPADKNPEKAQNRPAPPVAPAPVNQKPVYEPATQSAPVKKKGGDWLLIVAVIIALISIGVMIYAYYIVEMPNLDLR